jgi:hypothetical protein
MRNFVSPEDWRLPFFFVALQGCTPAAPLAGRLARLAGFNMRETGRA